MPLPAGQWRRWPIPFAVWVLVALLTRTSASSAHEWSRLGTIDSLVNHWSYDLSETRFRGTIDRIAYRGRYYSHQPPLLSTLEAPVYWSLKRFGLRFWNSAPFDSAYYLFTVATNGLALVITAVIFGRLLELVGVVSPLRPLYAFLLPFGTWLLPYGVVTNNHGISAMLLAGIAYLLVKVSLRGAAARDSWLLGTCAGLIAAFEVIPIVSFVPLTFLFMVVRPELRTRPMLRAFTLGLLTPLLINGVINLRLTGGLLPGGLRPDLFDYPGSAFNRESLAGLHAQRWPRGVADYARRALLSEKGFFTFAPILPIGLLVGLLGWRWWGRARAAQLVLLFGSILSLAVPLVMTNNFGGDAVGFRHMSYVCPAILSLLLPILADRRPLARVAAAAIGIVGAISAAGLLLFAVPQPWSQLRVRPLPTPSTDWRSYTPVVAYVVDRMSGAVDEFGNPSTPPP